jgi:hypothetical protein
MNSVSLIGLLTASGDGPSLLVTRRDLVLTARLLLPLEAPAPSIVPTNTALFRLPWTIRLLLLLRPRTKLQSTLSTQLIQSTPRNKMLAMGVATGLELGEQEGRIEGHRDSLGDGRQQLFAAISNGTYRLPHAVTRLQLQLALQV